MKMKTKRRFVGNQVIFALKNRVVNALGNLSRGGDLLPHLCLKGRRRNEDECD